MKHIAAVIVAAVVFAVSAPALAQVVETGPVEVGARLNFGFGDKLKTTVPGFKPSKDDLISTIGLQADGFYRVMDYVKVGALFGFAAMNTDAADDLGWGRSYWIDFSVAAKGQYQFPFGLELFGLVFLGPSGFLPNSDLDKIFGDIKSGAGLNFGFGVGAQYLVLNSIGLGLDLGYTLHWGKNSVKGLKDKVTFQMGQFTLALDFNYRF